MGAISYQSVTGLPVDSTIRDFTYLHWAVHVGLNLQNMYNNRQLVHCAW